jgi:hypothetical protein
MLNISNEKFEVYENNEIISILQNKTHNYFELDIVELESLHKLIGSYLEDTSRGCHIVKE